MQISAVEMQKTVENMQFLGQKPVMGRKVQFFERKVQFLGDFL